MDSSVSRKRPHFAAAYKNYYFKEFEFLQQHESSFCDLIDCPKECVSNIGTVSGKIPITNELEEKTIQELIDFAVPSLVGKGNKTVDDEETRSSKEILAKDIVL